MLVLLTVTGEMDWEIGAFAIVKILRVKVSFIPAFMIIFLSEILLKTKAVSNPFFED